MTELTVQVGTPADVHDVMELALMAVDENGIAKPDPERLLQEIWPALNLDRGIVGMVRNEEGKLEAAILLRISIMWYSLDEILEERAIFVHPEYRSAKGGRAARLCEFAKSVADELKLPLLIGVLSNTRTNAKVRMYERQFGTPAGAFFLYKTKTGDWKNAS